MENVTRKRINTSLLIHVPLNIIVILGLGVMVWNSLDGLVNLFLLIVCTISVMYTTMCNYGYHKYLFKQLKIKNEKRNRY